MWNCKCCDYTGSVICPARIVGHFTDLFVRRSVALPTPLIEFTVACVPRRLDQCAAVILGFTRYN